MAIHSSIMLGNHSGVPKFISCELSQLYTPEAVVLSADSSSTVTAIKWLRNGTEGLYKKSPTGVAVAELCHKYLYQSKSSACAV